MTEPPRPEGARLVHPDGTVTPLELAYDGLDEDGQHVWSATTAFTPGRDRVEVDRLPGKTSLSLLLPDA